MLRRRWYYTLPPALLALIFLLQPADRPAGVAPIPGYPFRGVATRWLTDDCDTLAYAMRAENAARGRKAGLVGPVWFDTQTGLHDYDPRHPERYEVREGTPFEPDNVYPLEAFDERLTRPAEFRPRYFLEYPPLAFWLFRLGLIGAPGENANVHPLLLDGHQFNVGCHAPATDGERALYARFRHALRIYAVLMTLAQLGLMLLLDFGFPSGRNPIPTWLLVLPGFLYFTPCRFDILPAALVMASILAADRKGVRMAALSGLLLGLAVGLKMYPLVLAPILLRYAATDWKRFLVWCGCAAVPVVLSYAGMYLPDGIEGVTVPLRFQLARDPETGWCFYGRLLPEALAHKTTPAALLSLLRRSALALLAFLTLSVFFSPQWWQWLAVLLVPLAARHRWLVGLIVANDLWTFLHFPVAFDLMMFQGGLEDSSAWVRELHVLVRAGLWAGLAGGLAWEEVRAGRHQKPN